MDNTLTKRSSDGEDEGEGFVVQYNDNDVPSPARTLFSSFVKIEYLFVIQSARHRVLASLLIQSGGASQLTTNFRN